MCIGHKEYGYLKICLGVQDVNSFHIQFVLYYDLLYSLCM